MTTKSSKKITIKRQELEAKEELKAFRKKWKGYTDLYRIEAVIHDGQWYTLEKWAKVASIKNIAILKEYIKNNKDLITFENSYRMPYDAIEKWYNDNDLDITESLVPRNFPPRFAERKTEAQHFIDSPRAKVSCLMIASPIDLMNKIKEIAREFGRVVITKDQRLYVYTLNADFLHYRIRQFLTPQEHERVKFRTRYNFKRRDLMDLSDEFLEKEVEFYYNFCVAVLRSHEKTMQIFLPDSDDRKGQIYEWILTAMQKFDEKSPVPFSGYLATVLQRWPYDLPDEELGKTLASFQRKRAKAIAQIQEEQDVDEQHISDKEICKVMGLSLKEFNILEQQHLRWTNLKNAHGLLWEENSQEKIGESVFIQRDAKEDIHKKFTIQNAILTGAVQTQSWKECIELLKPLIIGEKTDFNFENISDKYKLAIKDSLLIIQEVENDE